METTLLLILGFIVSCVFIFDTIVIFVAIILELIKNLKWIGSKYFFRDYIKKHLLSIEIYRWIIFSKYMIKLFIIDKFYDNEFHPWLKINNLTKIKKKHQDIYLDYLTKIRQKKCELES
ncbi:MAG: hypothetical protein PHT84_05450, partial [Candidatus Pacebacteria bacterium]|nr:hypothetical protein [Candidatus Paceibacterota bacterium]